MTAEAMKREGWKLTGEGEDYCKNGSPEVQAGAGGVHVSQHSAWHGWEDKYAILHWELWLKEHLVCDSLRLIRPTSVESMIVRSARHLGLGPLFVFGFRFNFIHFYTLTPVPLVRSSSTSRKKAQFQTATWMRHLALWLRLVSWLIAHTIVHLRCWCFCKVLALA